MFPVGGFVDTAVVFYEKLSDLVRDQAAWSQETFGSDRERGPEGPLRHLKLECDEILANPTDLGEWADGLILYLDAMRRAGFKMGAVIDEAVRKMIANKSRDWPKYIPFTVVGPVEIKHTLTNGGQTIMYSYTANRGNVELVTFAGTPESAESEIYREIREHNAEPVEHIR